MTVSTPGTNEQSGSGAQLKLHRRRDRAEAAKAAADKARADVAALDDRLQANAAHTENTENALQEAQDAVARLKKALRASEKDRAKLRAARKKARAAVPKTQRKARAAEARYDEIVLAEMVRREKVIDRAAAPQPEDATAQS